MAFVKTVTLLDQTYQFQSEYKLNNKRFVIPYIYLVLHIYI